MKTILKLIEVLEHTPKSNQILELIEQTQKESTVDITKQINQLTGAWELKWSTSNSPFLNYSPLLDNIQILDPERGR